MTSATTTATSIARRLVRLGNQPAPGGDDTGSPTRDEIRSVIAAASGPVTMEQICTSAGLHPNTVRPHLEVLLALGAIARERGPRRGRGRPPWLYRSTETPQEAERSSQARSLRDQLADVEDGDLADEAARRWASLSGERDRSADSIDAAVEQAADALSRIGFAVSVAPTMDRIDLMQCPYADLVADRPIICDIHAALVQRLLDGSGQPVELDRLEVWSRPGVCTAHLARNDYQPQRTITMRSAE